MSSVLVLHSMCGLGRSYPTPAASVFAVIETWLKQQRSIWERQLDRLGALLEAEDSAA